MTIITRVTHGVPRVPSAVERLAAWFERIAPTRASASLGDERALTTSPNVVPIHPINRMGKIEAVVLAVRLHCRTKHYPGWVERTASDAAMLRLRCGASAASAIASGKVRADFAARYGRDPEAA